jgi:photosystem II stability/assembly factor-like uncharacterized protein
MSDVRSRLFPRLLIAAACALALGPIATGLRAAPAVPQGGAPVQFNAPTDPHLHGFEWRSIGPTGQGGRIHALGVVERDPRIFYVGYATGGLWKTTNGGITFDLKFPIHDDHHTHSIGAIGIAPSNPDIVYVGTGEACNRQSSSFGTGVYKSTDGGETFTHLGLRETQSIGRVIVHPTDPNIVWVAAVGNLFGPNEERGVYMTTDGGRTWSKPLYIDQYTGATDIVVDPSNPNVLFAAMYQRQRSAWGFIGGGPGSGMHQSTDGGKTWRRMSGGGLPDGVMGRVGLAMSRSNPNVVYAQIEVAPTSAPAAGAPTPTAQGGDPTRSGVWRSADKGRTWTFMSNQNNRPMYYSHIEVDPTNEQIVYTGGVNAMKSVDGGATWTNIQGNGVGHVDNHAIWIGGPDGKLVMYGNDGGLAISPDGGESFQTNRSEAMGLPYHVSADMRRPYWVCTGLQDNGSWCGPSSVRNTQGIRMWDWISVGGGDGFQTQVDPTDHRIFYTESQNGALRRYNLNVDGTAPSIRPTAGGRGGGNIVPAPPDETQINFNWNSPIRISHHNPQTILYGGNRFFISRNRGDTWTMSEPLGKNIDASERSMMGIRYSLPSCSGRGGGTPQPCIPSKGDGIGATEARTIIEIAESPVVQDLYWAGTADGNLQISRDGGRSWTEVGRNIPGGTREYWISGLEASWHDAGTAYASLDGHHQNDLNPYVFKTADYGATWTNITSNLPWGHVNSVRQDPVNPNLLYVAHEFGFFISLNDGQQWHKFLPGLPTVRVDEVLVHPRDNDLILATHSRSVWIMDDITALQKMTPETLKQDAVLFTPRDAVAWKTDPRSTTAAPGLQHWRGDSAPRGAAISYFLRTAATGDVRVTIRNTATGTVVRACAGTGNAGLNRFQWPLTGGGAEGAPQPCAGGGAGGGRGGGGGGGGAITPGVYSVTLTVGGRDVGTERFSVLEDIWMHER